MCCTQQIKLAVLKKRQQEHTVPVESMDTQVRTCMIIEHVLTVIYKLSALHLISTHSVVSILKCCTYPTVAKDGIDTVSPCLPIACKCLKWARSALQNCIAHDAINIWLDMRMAFRA